MSSGGLSLVGQDTNSVVTTRKPYYYSVCLSVFGELLLITYKGKVEENSVLTLDPNPPQ